MVIKYILKLDTLVMIVAKFGYIWPRSFKGEDFVKVNGEWS